MVNHKRRGRNEDSIFFDVARQVWTGVIDLGLVQGKRKRVTIRAKRGSDRKQLVALLKAKHDELDRGIRTPQNYTFRRCVEDWFAAETRRGKKSAETMRTYRSVSKNIINAIGHVLVADLLPVDVQTALDEMADRLSTVSLRQNRMIAIQALHLAHFNRLVGENVAKLTETPRGRLGRPSRAFSLEQAVALMATARTHHLWAYVALSLLGGVRTEEARALHWSEVDFEHNTVSVIRAARVGGDTKTATSRRRLGQAEIVMQALKDQQLMQARDRVAAGSAWKENDYVFTTAVGTAFDPNNLREEFQSLTEAAGLGRNWVPRELRHTFVSVLSAAGVPLEDIADLVGHATVRTTDTVYRHQIKPVLRAGATVMDEIFGSQMAAKLAANGQPDADSLSHPEPE